MDELLSGQRILVVEDEFLVLMLIEDMMTDLGCESVSTAPSIATALALIDAKVFDAAMLDINLGGDKSFPIADALAARGVPFLFATGYDGNCVPAAHRARAVLRKPFQMDDLRAALTELPLPVRV